MILIEMQIELNNTILSQSHLRDSKGESNSIIQMKIVVLIYAR